MFGTRPLVLGGVASLGCIGWFSSCVVLGCCGQMSLVWLIGSGLGSGCARVGLQWYMLLGCGFDQVGSGG